MERAIKMAEWWLVFEENSPFSLGNSENFGPFPSWNKFPALWVPHFPLPAAIFRLNSAESKSVSCQSFMNGCIRNFGQKKMAMATSERKKRAAYLDLTIVFNGNQGR